MGIKSRLFKYYFPEIVATASIRNRPSTTGIVLMYHEVLPDEVTMPAWTIVRESHFRWQMSYLQKHFDIVTMDQALERVAGNVAGKKPFAVVTFDDGYRGNLDIALPIMESMGLPFIVYVATQAIMDNSLYWYDQVIGLLNTMGKIDLRLELDSKVEHFKLDNRANDNRRWEETQRLLTRLKQLEPEVRETCVRHIVDEHIPVGTTLKMLSSADLRRLADSDCVAIGSHTHRHELLDQLVPQDVHETLQTSNEIITRLTGTPPRHFSYPNGNFTPHLVKQIHEAGYDTAVTTRSGFWTPEEYRLTIPRLCVGRFDTKGQFKSRVAGYLQGTKSPIENDYRSNSKRGHGGTGSPATAINATAPINILYMIDNLAFGGTERQLVELIRNADPDRLRPHICTLKPSNKLFDELEIPKITLNFSSYSDFKNIAKVIRLNRFIKENRIQLVQTFFQDPFLFAAIIKPFNKVKLIGSFRDLGFWRTKAESRKMRMAYPFFSGFIANSQAVKEHFVAMDGLRADKIEVIHNGFDMQRIELQTCPGARDNNNPIVGIVGNFNRQVKRIDDFVRAAALVSRHIPRTRFVIVGDGELRNDLENLAVQLGVLDKIEFTGRVEHPLRYIRDFSIGVITSETEGFCNAIVEYMANGIPVVVTDVGGNPELVTDGENGFLVPVDSPEMLADKIVHLLIDLPLCREIGEKNKEKITEGFGISEMIAAHDRFYGKILRS